MASALVLPPLVKGKLYGYLKIILDEIVWWRKPPLITGNNGCNCGIVVKLQWWGSNKPLSFRPFDVAQHNYSSDSSDKCHKKSDLCKVFEIRTNLRLFENYLKHCENLCLYIIEEKSGKTIGSIIIKDISKLLYDDISFNSRYYPILNEFNNRIGDLRVNFNLKLNVLKETQIGISDFTSENNNNIKIDSTGLKLCKKHSVVFKNYKKESGSNSKNVLCDTCGCNKKTNVSKTNSSNIKKSHTINAKTRTNVSNQMIKTNKNSENSLMNLGLTSVTKCFDSCEGYICPPNTFRTVADSYKKEHEKVLNRVLNDGVKLRNAMLLSVIKDDKKNDVDVQDLKNDHFLDKLSETNMASTINLSNYESMKPNSTEALRAPLLSTFDELTLTDYLSGKPMSAREEQIALETLRSISPRSEMFEVAATTTTNSGKLCENEILLHEPKFKEEQNSNFLSNPEQVKPNNKITVSSVQHQQITRDDLNGNGESGTSSECKDFNYKNHLISEQTICSTDDNIHPVQLGESTIQVASSITAQSNLPITSSVSSAATLSHCNDMRDKIVNDIDCYRLTVEKLVLNDHGVKKVNYIECQFSTKKNKHQLPTKGRLNLTSKTNKTSGMLLPPGQVYFLECNTGNNNNKKKKINHHLHSPVRFCSKKCAGNVILFGHTMMKKITKCDKTQLVDGIYNTGCIERLLHLLNVELWRIFLRHLNQRVPSFLGKLISPSSLTERNRSDQILSLNLLEQHLFLPLITEAGLIIGHLYIKLELGKDKKIFGYSLLGDKLLLNLKNHKLTEAEVQTDLVVINENQYDKNSCEIENVICSDKINENSITKKTECSDRCSHTMQCYCLEQHVICDSQNKNERPFADHSLNKHCVTEDVTPIQTQDKVISAHFKTIDSNDDSTELCHVIVFTINNVVECPLFNSKSEDISCYVEYTFPDCDHHNISTNGRNTCNGDSIQVCSTNVVRGNVYPSFNYEHQHTLVSTTNKSLSSTMKMYTQASSVTFSVWVRFYHPRPRDHMIATALLPFSCLYTLETQYCDSKENNEGDVIEFIKLPLKLIPCSITNIYLRTVKYKQNFGFLNLTLKYFKKCNKDFLLSRSKTHPVLKPLFGSAYHIESLNKFYKTESRSCVENEQLKFMKSLDKLKNRETLCDCISNNNTDKLCCVQCVTGFDIISSLIHRHELACFRPLFHRINHHVDCNGNRNNCKNGNCNLYHCCNNVKTDEAINYQQQQPSSSSVNLKNKTDNMDSELDLIQIINHDTINYESATVKDKYTHLHSNEMISSNNNEMHPGNASNTTNKNVIENSKLIDDETYTLKCIKAILSSSILDDRIKLDNTLSCHVKFDSEHFTDKQTEKTDSIIKSIYFDNYKTNNDNYFIEKEMDKGDWSSTKNKTHTSTINDDIVVCDNSENQCLSDIFITEKGSGDPSSSISHCTVNIERGQNLDKSKSNEQSIDNFIENENISSDEDEVDIYSDTNNLTVIENKIKNKLQVRIEIERALHLHLIKCNFNDNETDMIPPTTCAIIYIKSDDENEMNLVSPIIKNSCCPFYNAVFNTYLPIKLLHQVLGFGIRVQLVDEFGHLSEECIGSAAINLNIFSNGFSSLRGWFNLLDSMGNCNGQIKINVIPLEDIPEIPVVPPLSLNLENSSICSASDIKNVEDLETNIEESISLFTPDNKDHNKYNNNKYSATIINSAELREKLNELDYFMENLKKNIISDVVP